MKKCTKCNENKPSGSFSKDKHNPSGLKYWCKECATDYAKSNKEKIKEYQARYSKTDKCKKTRAIYRELNKNAMMDYQKNYFKANKERIYARNKKKRDQGTSWEQRTREARREKTRAYHNKYAKKYSKDILCRLRRNLRTRLYIFLRKDRLITFSTYVGCTLDYLKSHLESKFYKHPVTGIAMSWENYGRSGWHIDHIIPLASAKTEEEVYKLCHYTNLQPLWAEENIAKHSKVPV